MLFHLECINYHSKISLLLVLLAYTIMLILFFSDQREKAGILEYFLFVNIFLRRADIFSEEVTLSKLFSLPSSVEGKNLLSPMGSWEQMLTREQIFFLLQTPYRKGTCVQECKNEVTKVVSL